jgi:hypothetical protein
MAKQAKKIAVKSNIEASAKLPKVTQKTVNSALRTETHQENVKKFAFPAGSDKETKGSKALTKAELKKSIAAQVARQAIVDAWDQNSPAGVRTFVALKTKPKKSIGWVVSGVQAGSVIVCHERFVMDRHSTTVHPIDTLVLFKTELKDSYRYRKGDFVEHPHIGIGKVVKVKGNDVYDVLFKGDDEAIGAATGDYAEPREVPGEELKLTSKPEKAATLTRFENLPLLCAFAESSGTPGGKKFVKVGGTTAIEISNRTTTDKQELPALLLTEFGSEGPKDKVRFKKAAQVKPLKFRNRDA